VAYPAPGYMPYPPSQWSILPGTQELIFIAVFSINFNSTALFKNAFLELDLAGKIFGRDFEQPSPRKMKKHMFPIARLASGLPSGGHRPYPPLPQGEGFQHRRRPTNLAIILKYSRFST